MIDDRPPAVRGGGAFSALASDGLTHVELTWIEKKLEHWIRFGRVAQDRILTRRTRVVGFRPGAVFAFVRWASNDFGTIVSRIDVVRAVAANESYTTLPFVRPGGPADDRDEGRRHPAQDRGLAQSPAGARCHRRGGGGRRRSLRRRARSLAAHP